jgi:hypothetical protein
LLKGAGNYLRFAEIIRGVIIRAKGEVQAADYIPFNNPVSHISGMLSMHLIYDIKHDNQTWNKKPFSQSRGHMYQNYRDWPF